MAAIRTDHGAWQLVPETGTGRPRDGPAHARFRQLPDRDFGFHGVEHPEGAAGDFAASVPGRSAAVGAARNRLDTAFTLVLWAKRAIPLAGGVIERAGGSPAPHGAEATAALGQ